MIGQRRCVTLSSIAVLAFAVVALVGFGTARADVPGLEIVQPAAVAVTADGPTSSQVSVWVRNGTGKPTTARFSALVENDSHEQRGVLVSPATGDIDAGAVERFELTLATPDTQRQNRKPRADLGKLTGQLVASAGGAAPATVGLTVAAKPTVDVGVSEALWLPAVLAVLLMTVAAVCTLQDKVTFRTPLPSDLDFSDSYASKLTTVGALFGTFVSAGVLPDDTVGLSKTAFVALNLVFGVAVAVAALVYVALQRRTWKKIPLTAKEKQAGSQQMEEPKLCGSVGGLLIASTVTIWAVLGELLTLWLLFGELGADQGFNGAALAIMRGLLIIALLLTIVYTIVVVPTLAQSKRVAQQPKTKRLKQAFTKLDVAMPEAGQRSVRMP
jgi:hypothetical protein